jgi:DNA-binding MarR family transcriptional regulator
MPELEDQRYRDALEMLILTSIIAKEGRQGTEQRLKGFGAEVTAPQYRILRQLEQGSATLTVLSQSMMVEPATLVPMVDTLERHGYIRRGHDPRDRRRTPLELTESGRERLQRIPYVHEADPIAHYLGTLPDAEREAFLRRLRELVVVLHGHDHAVSHITDAVNTYFEYGERQHVEHAGDEETSE